MKICIFADIHGNIEAFEKMYFREQDKVDLFLFVGDIFGYFYGQLEILDSFMTISNLIALRGNHDKYYLTGQDIDTLSDKYGSSYKISLSKKQRKYIENLPEHMELVFDNKRIAVYHGGPADYLEQRIYPNSFMDNKILEQQVDYMILAHTHYQMLRKVGDMTLINPGSLGQPRDGRGFGYCILETDNGKCNYKTVNINISELIMKVKDVDNDKYVYEYLRKKYSL